MSKFPPLDTISLYHSSLGALEQPGKVNIRSQIGSWISCHSHTPTQKRTHSGYPLPPSNPAFLRLLLESLPFRDVIVEPCRKEMILPW